MAEILPAAVAAASFHSADEERSRARTTQLLNNNKYL